MKNMRVVASVAIGLISVAALLFLSCGPAQDVVPEKLEPHIAGVFQVPNIDFWIPTRIGAQDAAKEYGCKWTFTGPPGMEIDKLISIFETTMAAETDGIVAQALDGQATVPVATRAKEAGIPIIITNDSSTYGIYDAWCGADGYEIGQRQGEELVRCLRGETSWAKSWGYEGGEVSGKIAVINAWPGLRHMEARVQGARDYLEQYPGIEYMPQVFGGTDISHTKEACTNILVANPDLKGFVLPGDLETAGAGQAIQELGLEGKVVIVGMDLTEINLTLVEEKVVAALTGQNPYDQGYLPVKAIAEYLLHGTAMAESYPTAIELITCDNIDEVLEREAAYIEAGTKLTTVEE